MTDIVIIGAGGHGKVVLDILRAGSQYRPIGFLDADPKLAGSVVGGLAVYGSVHLLSRLKQQYGFTGAIVAIGDNRARAGYVETLRGQKIELINAIHPAAVVSTSAIIGRNVVVAAQGVICTEARIGDCVIINTAATVDHECEIGQSVHVCPGAHLAGRVRVGPRSIIGMGANVLQCLEIGRDAIVGAGSVVLRDVVAGCTVVGVPARVIRTASPLAA